MKTLIKVLTIILALSIINEAQSQYPFRTIRDLQSKPIDSLLVADQLQSTVPSRWTLQSGNYLGDTIKVVGVCIIPPKVMNYTTFGHNFVLADTGYSGAFGYILIRPNISSSVNPGDTILYQNMLNVEKGDIVEVVGRIWDFPGLGESGYPTMNSMTQIIPLKDPNFTIIGQSPLPPIVSMQTSDFYEGVYPSKVKYSTGEPFESGYVELTNLTVVSTLNPTNGTVNLMDDNGNMISTYDASKWWTLRGHKDPNSTYTSIFPVNTRIDTIRGWITTVSGGENPRGYRISPIEPNDVVLGVARPSVYSVRRYPVIVLQDSAPRIEAVIKIGPGGSTIESRLLNYSVDNGPFIIDTMLVVSGDTLYQATIPIQPVGSFIRYFIKATDINGYSTISANGAGGGLGADTTKGFYFYHVTTEILTINDIQFTPFANGRSPYVGAVTTIQGIVTADTSDLLLAPQYSGGGTNVWFIQSGNSPFSGIWITGTIPELNSLSKDDSVAITGTIQENFDVTRIGNVSSVQLISSGNPLPLPVELSTAIFGPGAGNGDLGAEPYEGMLVEFDTVTVTDIWPSYSYPSEYAVSDGSGSTIIRRDGKNTYSNVPGDTIYPGTAIIKVGDKFSKLTGIVHYSFNRYKIVPRTNSDFGTYIPLSVNDRIDGPIPTQYQLSNNYPNPFNPTTVIEYALPKEDKVSLKIYNVIGQEVATLKNEIQKAGTYRVSFDGAKLATGVYFYRLQTSGFNQVKKMLLVK